MNVEQATENKTDEVLSFRIESIDIQALETGLKLLNPDQMRRVKKSDLARKAFRRGLSLAMQEEITIMEQEEKQRKLLERAKGFEPSTFTLARCLSSNGAANVPPWLAAVIPEKEGLTLLINGHSVAKSSQSQASEVAFESVGDVINESPVAGNGGDLSGIHGNGNGNGNRTAGPSRVGKARSHRPGALYSKAA